MWPGDPDPQAELATVLGDGDWASGGATHGLGVFVGGAIAAAGKRWSVVAGTSGTIDQHGPGDHSAGQAFVQKLRRAQPRRAQRREARRRQARRSEKRMLRRLNPIYLSAVAAVLMLLALPQTRWLVLGHVQQIAGRTTTVPWLSEESWYGVAIPKAVNEPEHWKSSTSRQELGAAIAQTANYHAPAAIDAFKKYAPLRDFVASHPDDTVARATYACYATLGLGVQGTLKTGDDRALSALKSNRAYATEVLTAVRDGAKYEPDNALYPVLSAAANLVLGDEKLAFADYVRASNCRDYNVHAQAACEAEWEGLEASSGYQGQVVRVLFYAGYLLPQDSQLKSLATYMIRERGTEGRVAAAKFARTMATKSNVLIDLLVARSIAFSAIGDVPHETAREPKLTFESLVGKAATLDKSGSAHGFSFSAYVEEMKPYLRKPDKPKPKVEVEQSLRVQAMHSAAAAGILLFGFLALPLLWLVERVSVAKVKYDRFAFCAPFGIWLLSIPWLSAHTEAIIALAAGVLALTAAIFVPAGKRGIVSAAGFCLAVVVMASGFAFGIGIGVTFIVCELLSRVTLKRTWQGLLLGTLLLIAVLAGCYVGIQRVGLVGPILALSLFIVAGTPRGVVWPSRLRFVTVSAASFAYILLCGVLLLDDGITRSMLKDWGHETENYRSALMENRSP